LEARIMMNLVKEMLRKIPHNRRSDSLFLNISETQENLAWMLSSVFDKEDRGNLITTDTTFGWEVDGET